MSQVKTISASAALLLVGVISCGGKKAEPAPEQKPTPEGEAITPTATIGGVGGPDMMMAAPPMEKALEAKMEMMDDPLPNYRSFFKEASPICHQTYEATTFSAFSTTGLKPSSAFSCWPSGRCEGFVENVGEPIKIRKIKFGDETSALEQAFLDKFQELAQQNLKTLAPTLNETERTFIWRDFMADTQEEKDLRDVYKVMSLWSSVSLKWLPCKGESGSACSVQPQAQFAMLAVTPQANSAGDGASCTLFFGIPDETKASGFSKPSNIMRQMKGAVRPSLDSELQKLGTCGDNNIQKQFEQCDDGNTTANDGCSADCKIEVK